MPNIEFVCLAISRKMSARCVAGIRTDNGMWIRPISNLRDGELQPHHYQDASGRTPELLELITVEFTTPDIKPHHPEDFHFNPAVKWIVDGSNPKTAVEIINPQINVHDDVILGFSDSIPLATVQSTPLNHSLQLIRPEEIISLIIKDSMRGNRQIRIYFKHKGKFYNLSVTDISFCQRFKDAGNGFYKWKELKIENKESIILTISLGELFKEQAAYYKLIAAVVFLPHLS